MTRVDRPYTRRAGLLKKVRNESNAGALARRAGKIERPSVDTLERRQLLFSLVVTADSVDQNTGIGTAQQYFAYVLPRAGLIADLPAAQPPTVLTEDFNDEPIGAVGSGQFMLVSNILVRHNVVPGRDIRIGSDQPPPNQSERFMFLDLHRQGEFASFQLFNTGANPTTPVGTTGVTFLITGDNVPPSTADLTGLMTDNMAVDLILANRVTATITGQQLRAAIQGDPARGTGQVTLAGPAGDAVFDTVRIRTLSDFSGGITGFRLDNMAFTVPVPRFVPQFTIVGVMAEISGPVGARADFFDLYGRPMVASIALGVPSGGTLLNVDIDDNGIPSSNDGIGSIRMSNTDSRTSFTMWGTDITAVTQRPIDSDFFDPAGFSARLKTSLNGSFDEFEQGGFGFTVDNRQQGNVFGGLPPGIGDVIIGSPFVRPLNAYNPAGYAGAFNVQGVGVFPISGGFTNPDQGIFVDGGASIASVYIHGMVFGSSVFSGAVDRITIGYLPGSITVRGDLGSLIVGGDAGIWAPDARVPGVNDQFDTGGQVVVERTIGRVDIGGRSLMDITVVGDLNSPTTRPARDSFTFYETEFLFGIQQGVEGDVVRAIVNSSGYVARQPSDRFRTTDQASVFSNGVYRNDTIMGAEFINGASSGVRIIGDLSGSQPGSGEDRADVYAFATDGVNDVVFDTTGNIALARVIDGDGRTLSAPQLGVGAERTAFGGQFTFKPQAPGIYYLVLTDGNLGDNGANSGGYSVAVTGLASVALGSVRTAAALGVGGVAPSITVLTGAMGVLRVGTGVTTGGGADDSPLGVFNNPAGLNVDDALSFSGASVATQGNLYGIIAGSDIGLNPIGGLVGSVRFTIGGNLGMLQTGQSPAVGLGVGEGDANFLALLVSGSIGSVNISGGIGMDQDAVDNNGDRRAPSAGTDSVIIRTGEGGGAGDIGFFRTGFSVVGDALNVHTTPGSTVGAFLIAQDAGEYQASLGLLRGAGGNDTRFGVYGGIRGIPFFSGSGSSVRFVDIPKLDISNAANARTELFGGTPVTMVDDSGASVTFNVEGFGVGALGEIVSIPIDGSQGVAVGLVDVDLAGGRTLHIQGVGNGGNFQIGRIRIRNADASSRIEIDGGVQVDVYRIDMDTGAGAMFEIVNNTVGGDFVAVDVAGLTQISVVGNLGTTEVPAWGPRLIGPELGLDNALAGGVGGAIGFAAGAGFIDPDFGGNIYRPIALDTALPGAAFLDDIGGPMDSTLNGLIVRTGDVQDVQVRGSIRDVILQGAGATLVNLRANSDGTTAFGAFDGIVGNIYAARMTTIDIGDGLAAADPGPLLSASIIASDDIDQIMSSRGSGASIKGVIIAVNAGAPGTTGATEGLTHVNLNNGIYDGAFIASMAIDSFWNGLLYSDPNLTTGDIDSISGTNTNFFRSRADGRNVRNFSLDNGYFDASELNIVGRGESISATGYRNSTLLGGASELKQNIISTAGDLVSLTAVNDIEDLVVDITGSLIGSITSRNLTRSSINVDNSIESLTTRASVKSSEIVAGELRNLQAAVAIESSSVAISGPINNITAGTQIANTKIDVTGPDGRIDSITARDLISGDISASGPISTVQSTQGDLVANITTTTSRGNVSTLRAGRDVVAAMDISGNLQNIIAGRNIGSVAQKGVVLVRGNLASANAANGQLYSDIRSGGAIDSVSVGRGTNKPGNNQVGSGSIISFGRLGTVSVAGDFGGDIISYSGGIGSISITNGSFLRGRTIAAFAGDLNSLTITNGNLLGNVLADYDIKSLGVTRAGDGVFGNVGIANGVSQFTSYDAFRNQLPTGTTQTPAKDGPRIAAGKDIVNISVAGSVVESVFQAGRSIRSISIGANTLTDALTSGYSTAFVAGDSIDSITISGNADLTQFLAGVVDLGADNRPGGLGNNADLVKSGTITRVAVSGTVTNSQFLSGISAGIDGNYGTGDDKVALGSSTIGTLSLGNASNVLAEGDSLSAAVAGDSRLIRITALPSVDPLLDNGLGTPGAAVVSGQAISFQGGTITFALTGPGRAFFDATNGRLTLRDTTSSSTLVVNSSLATLNNLSIVTNDDASLGSLRVTPAVDGTSQFVIDGNVGTLDLGSFSGSGRITVGGDISTANLSTFVSGTISARNIATLIATGDFGVATPGSAGRPAIRALTGGTMTFRGAMRGIVSVDRDLSSVSMTGVVFRSDVRVGWSLQSYTASAGTTQLVLSVGQSIGSINVSGNVLDSAFLAGVDLGSNAAFGGTGTAADKATTGSIGSVSVSGTFLESDIIAGYLRGADGFYGTGDDTVAPGLSTIGSITIGGSQVGSTRLSESYRIASSGDVGTVRVGGTTMTSARGNFALEASRGQLVPVNIRPIDIKVSSDSGQYVAEMIFNQPIDFSTIKAGLSVSEVRGSADVTIRLIEGSDYTITPNAANNSVLVRFSRGITTRNLPAVPGQPGPGVYRFELDQTIVRGKSLAARVDGNNDGFSTPGDNYVGHAIVGDAGDKFFSEVVTAGTGASATRVDFYGSENLDFILDDRAHPDGLPDPNRNFVVRGVIGDHPDNDAINFNFAGDTDVYSVTLQAGQIVRISALRGAASQAPVTLFDPNNVAITELAGNGAGFGGLDTQASAVVLPASQDFVAQQLVRDTAYLIKTTGVYRLVVGQSADVNSPGAIFAPNSPSQPGTIGAFEFDFFIFDDGDSGFASSTNSGNGTGLVNAPDPIVFAGADLAFNTADDLPSVTVGGYTFSIAQGADNILGTSDDVVSGINSLGHTSTRVGNTLTSTVSSSIGPAAHSGIPGEVTSDVDIYQLNNGAAIVPGTKMRVTIKLDETGSNIGSSLFVGRFDANLRLPDDQRGNVQFGIFETTGLTNVTDANIADGKLVFSPTDFRPFSADGARVIADNGSTKYGYDANGDYYIEFATPDSVVTPGFAGSFALYLQGVFNADYKIEVVTQGTGGIPTHSQNFFIETHGGSVNWLEAGNHTTNLQRFSAASIGFNGFVDNNQNADEYILGNLVSQLNSLFTGAGYNVAFSTNPADFEFQPFSTIYLSSTNDPINSLFGSFDFATRVQLPGQGFLNTPFFSTQPFGFSQHSDPFNTDQQDAAAVFAPSFSLLGLTPSKADVDVFTDSLTGAVARRAGELLGLRLNTDDTFTNPAFDFQASNSPQTASGFPRNFAFPAADRQLSSGFDSIANTNFFLGRQNTSSLLNKILTRS